MWESNAKNGMIFENAMLIIRKVKVECYNWMIFYSKMYRWVKRFDVLIL